MSWTGGRQRVGFGNILGWEVEGLEHRCCASPVIMGDSPQRVSGRSSVPSPISGRWAGALRSGLLWEEPVENHTQATVPLSKIHSY